MKLNIQNSIGNIGKKIITFPNNFHFSCSTHDNDSPTDKDLQSEENNSKNTVTKEELGQKNKEFREKQQGTVKTQEQYHYKIQKKQEDLEKKIKDKLNFKADPMEFVDELYKILLSKEANLARKKYTVFECIDDYLDKFIQEFENGGKAPDLKKFLELNGFILAANDEEKKILADPFGSMEEKKSLWWIVYGVIGILIGVFGGYLFGSRKQ